MSEWKTVRLGDVCEIAAGQGAPQGDSNYCNDGTPFVKAGNLIELIEGKHENQIQKVSEEVAKSHKLKKYSAGSILFAKSGMSCMKGYVYQLKNDSYVVSHLAIVKPKEDSSNYIEYCLRHIKPNTLVKDEAYPSISLQDISNIQIPLPPLEEQKHIANVLDKCTVLIAKYKKMLAKYDTLIKSRFIEMFGENPIDNGKWDVRSLDNLCTVTSSKRIYAEEQSSCGVPFLRISDLVSRINGFPTNELFIPNKKFKEFREKSLVPVVDDILITSRGTLGLCYIITPDDEFYFQDGMITWLAFENHNEILSIFIDWLFKTILKMKIDNETNGATVKYISISDLKNLKIPVPPLSLQNQFAAFVHQIDKSKFAVQKSLEKTETLYKSLMQEYFG